MSTLKTHNLQSPDAGSVNIVMAPNAGMVVAGLSTYSNQINVGSNIKLGNAGVVTATSFVGNGTNASFLNLTKSSTTAYNDAATTNDSTANLINSGAAGHATLQLQSLSGGSANTGQATISAFNESSGSKNTALTFGTRQNSDATVRERLRIDSGGRLLVGDSNATGAAIVQVQKTSGDMLLVRNHATNYESLILSVASGTADIYASSGGSTSRPALRFITNDAERLRITSAGNIGINSTSPSAPLEIHTAASAAWKFRINTSVSDGAGFYQRANGDFEMVLRDASDGNNYIAGTSGALQFATGGTERARIDSNGQLLVGTTSSGANVRAVFQGYNGGGENFQARVQFQTNQATNLSTNHHLANLLFTNASNSVGAEIRVQADEAWGTNDYPTRISFLTTPNGSATRSERLIIKNDGIVNIGVSSPQYAKKLNVQGGNDSQISVSNQDYTGYAAGSMAGIEGRLQCGNSVWSSAGIKFKKFNGTIGDKHTYLELYATDGYSNKVGLVVQPDGEVTKPLTPSFAARLASNIDMTSYGANDITFATEEFDVGSNYDNSNGRFTAPVAGKYYFGVQLYAGFDGNGVRVLHAHFRVNGSSVAQTDMFGGASNHGGTHYHPTAAGHMIRSLNQNDYVTFNMGGFSHTNGQAILYASTGNRFFGYLIG